MDTFIGPLIGFALGFFFAFFDMKKGRYWYRSWYKLTHKEGLPEDSPQTFIQNQPFSKRLVPAVILSAIVGYILFATGGLNWVLLLINTSLMLVAMMFSFYAFPFLIQKISPKLGQVRDTIKKIDELEASLKRNDVKEKPEMDKMEPPKDAQKSDDKKDDNWRSGVKDFLDK